MAVLADLDEPWLPPDLLSRTSISDAMAVSGSLDWVREGGEGGWRCWTRRWPEGPCREGRL